MSMRRIDLGSGNHTTENQDEIRNGRTHVQRKKFNLLVCVLCIGIVLTVPQLASSQDKSQCLPRCWNKVSQDISFTDGVHLETVSDERDCKDFCFNNETCSGVYWGFDTTLMNTSCWLQMPLSGTSGSLRNANYWNLTTCSDDCLPYCWLPKWLNAQTEGGVVQKDIDAETQCKSVCSKDPTCNGVDWNPNDASCWLLFAAEIKRNSVMDPVHHWEILRNLQVNCTNEHQDEPNAFGETETSSNATLSKSKDASNEAKKQPSVGESNQGRAGEGYHGILVPSSNGSGFVVFNESLHCPNYLSGIITMTALLGICTVITICLIAYVIYLQLEQSKLQYQLDSKNPVYRDYQSIQFTPDGSETSEGGKTDVEY